MKKEIANYDTNFKIGSNIISNNHPVFFIADIGANHDGSLKRAKKLIKMCADAGAGAAKFQHFRAETIVSDVGFKNLDPKFLSHQSKWNKSVYDVYKAASINLEWDEELKKTCDDCGIEYMTSPYDISLVDHVDNNVNAFKIGSGDITWTENLKKIASKGKPVLLACGASTIEEILNAVKTIVQINPKIALLQCNTNYTGSIDNFNYINLNVIKTFEKLFPNMILGLSDHTPGSVTTLGAVTLGAKIIEKHFTDDNSRVGPDHSFAMNPKTWLEMVNSVRLLEKSLGDGVKKVEDNETGTVVIQRRCLRANSDLAMGTQLALDNISALRPCPSDAIDPSKLDFYLGKKLLRSIKKGDYFKESDFS